MPRTSYALKAAGLSIAVMLVACLPAAAALAGRDRPVVRVLVAIEPAGGRSGSLVSLLDPTTLRRLQSVSTPASDVRHAVRSPDGERIALVDANDPRLYALRFRDGRTPRDAGFAQGVVEHPVAWPLADRVITAEHRRGPRASDDVVVRDGGLKDRRVHRLRGQALELFQTRDGAAALVDAGNRLFVQVFRGRSRSVASLRLPIMLGEEVWHSRMGSLLPPLARAAVARARDAAASGLGVAKDAVVLRGVERRLVNACERANYPWDYHPGYVVHVRVGGTERAFAYGVPLGGDRLERCWSGEGRALNQPYTQGSRDLLVVAPGTWHVTWPAIAFDRARDRLLVTGAGAPMTVLDLRTGAAHRVKNPIGLHSWETKTPWSRPAVWLDRQRVAVSTGTGVAVVGLRSARHQWVSDGGVVGVGAGRLFVAPRATAAVDALAFNGRRVYELALPQPEAGVTVCGHRTYVNRSWFTTDGGAQAVRVYDSRSGRRLAERRVRLGTRLLADASSAC